MKLSTKKLTKKFGNFTAVDEVSLEFEPGQIHAIVGENGAGKSTFLKLLFGLHEPTSGEVFIDGASVRFTSALDAIRSGLGMVQQHFTLVEPLSAIDNIILGAEITQVGILKRDDAIALIEKRLPDVSLRVPWETKVSELTVGQRQRVEILKLLFRDSKILFLDEPTAVLTPQETLDLFDVLRSLRAQGRTIVLITHKMREVLDVCDTYAVFRHGRLVSKGSVAGVDSSIIVEAMIGRALAPRNVNRVAPHATDVLVVKDMSESLTSRGMLRGVSLHVAAGEIVGIAGVEGSGQSSFVEAVMGLRNFGGQLKVLGEVIAPFETSRVRELGVGLVPEDRHHQALWLDESCKTNFVIGLDSQFFQGGLLNFESVDSKSDEWAKDFDVRASSLDVTVGALSGGNQQKLIFAREVSGRKPHLLICHQPTRGVDLAAIDLIYRRLEELRNEGLGILVISSELDELLDVCDRLYVFFDGRVSAEFTRAEFDRLAVGRAMTGESRAQVST